jgi:uncharacterized protein YndB with AHSA1/START domain
MAADLLCPVYGGRPALPRLRWQTCSARLWRAEQSVRESFPAKRGHKAAASLGHRHGKPVQVACGPTQGRRPTPKAGDMPNGSEARLRGSAHRAFSCFVPAEPERVWEALTDARHTSAYLYGLAAHSTWEIDAPIEFQAGEQSGEQGSLVGRVVCVQQHRRLSYFVQAGPDDPPTYLTWLTRPSPGGVTVRLYIDEIECGDDEEGAEDVWLPVLTALQRHLAG